MQNYILIVAGEDSGDVIGEDVVKLALQTGFDVIGAGGTNMRNAGLKSVVNFDDMAVNGFSDVLKKLGTLWNIKRTLQKKLKNKNCKALICIDYPGMNMPLMKLAKKLNKPVFYIAPPQIWAWKKKRGKHFKGVSVGVFFDFEKKIYEQFGAKVTMVRHPALKPKKANPKFKDKTLFLPGSRLEQVKRNLPKYLQIASKRNNALFVASRKEIYDYLTAELGSQYEVTLKNSEYSYAGAAEAFCMPGTAALELYFSDVKTTAIAVIEPLTFIIGKLFLKTKYLTLPNIIAGKEVIEEKLYCNFN